MNHWVSTSLYVLFNVLYLYVLCICIVCQSSLPDRNPIGYTLEVDHWIKQLFPELLKFYPFFYYEGKILIIHLVTICHSHMTVLELFIIKTFMSCIKGY